MSFLSDAVDPVRTQVAEGDDLDAGPAVQAVDGRARSPAAAADDADLDGVRALGEDAGHAGQRRRQRRRRRRLDEFATIHCLLLWSLYYSMDEAVRMA